MRRPVFLSFYYDEDVDRMQQIRNMGIVEGQQLLSPNEFEQVRRRGDTAVKKWIDEQLKNKQCLIVLVGEHTAERPYVQYEIRKAYEKHMPMFGIYIHNIKDLNKHYSKKGKNPFEELFGRNTFYRCIDPSHIEYEGYKAYNNIYNNIENWIEQAIEENRYRYHNIF